MLKQLITAKGVKQKWLAKQIGVSEVTLSNWIKGVYKPTDENLKKMAQFLNVDFSELKKLVHGI